MTIDEIRDDLKSKRVLFATNGDYEEFNPLKLSIRTYCDIVSDGNIMVLKSEHGKWCGKNAFLKIFDYASENGFEYLIYIDADCFITSCENLFSLFENFRKSGCILSGPPDGGLFCHRNFNRFAINPFLMFVDIKKIVKNFRNEEGVWKFDEKIKNYSYESLCEKVGDISKNSNSDVISAYAAYRENRKNCFKVPHADVISSPHNNHEAFYGNGQNPWSCSKNMNFESYYDIFLRIHDGENDILFMNGRDYPCEADESGITSAIYCNSDIVDDGNLVCLHTWFTRLANPNIYGEFGTYHKDRIRSVYNLASKFKNKNISIS